MNRSVLFALVMLSCMAAVRAQDAPVDPQAPGEMQAAPDSTQGVGDEGGEERQYLPWPAPDAGYVTDLADLLSLEQEIELEGYLWPIEADTGVEIAIVTVNSIGDYPGTSNQSIESFARGLFNKWGVGNLPGNNGVLLVVALHDRKARVELGAGYGNLRDGDARRIMDGEIIPRFKKGHYAEGVIAGTKALGLQFASVRYGFNWPMLVGIMMLVLSVTTAVSLFRSGKRGWGWVAVGSGIIAALYVAHAFRAAHRANEEWGGGGWSGGSAGGFGGGFGGGSSGGGGASGSW